MAWAARGGRCRAGSAWRGGHLLVRGPSLRGALGHADLRGGAPVAAGDRLCASGHGALCAGLAGDHGGAGDPLPGGRARLDRRGVPGCLGSGAPDGSARGDRRAGQGGDPGGRRSHRLGWRRSEPPASPSLPPTSASPTASPSFRPIGCAPSWTPCRSRCCAVSGSRRDRGSSAWG